MAELNVSLHYPNDPNYDFETKLVRLNLDKEREHDLATGNGFIVSSPKAVKEIINAEIEKREKPNYDGVTLKEMCELGIITVEEGSAGYMDLLNRLDKVLDKYILTDDDG